MPNLFLQYLQNHQPDEYDFTMSIIMLDRLLSQASSGYFCRCADLAEDLFAEKERIVFAGYSLLCSMKLDDPIRMPQYIRLYLYEPLKAMGLVELFRIDGKICYRIAKDASVDLSRSIRSVREWLHEHFPTVYKKPEPLRRPLSAFEKLQRRIEREFDKKPFIGDIRIDDKEYSLLIEHFKNIYHRMLIGGHDRLDKPVVATALVQVGIRYYDGAYWPHVAHALGVPAIQPPQQSELGRGFIKTLRKHGKAMLEESKYVSNILLHGIVSNHYMSRFFDFLLSYYDLDLERDISRASIPDLSSSILNANGSKRTYMLVQQTTDALKAYPRGIRIRLGRYLRLIDKAFWNPGYCPGGISRMNRLFWEWVRCCDFFRPENQSGMERRRATGRRAFSSPYYSVSLQNGTFKLNLPAQKISFDEPVDLGVSWRIRCGDLSTSYPCEAYQVVTSYKTEEQAIPWPQTLLFREVNFDLFCGNHRLRTFKIPSDDCRFFDEDARLVVSRFLPSGRLYAITPQGYDMSSSGYMESSTYGDLMLSTFDLEKDDVIFLSGGRIASTGGRIDEGLMSRGKVPGVSVVEGNETLPIYSSAPAVILKLQESQVAGTRVCLDDKVFRLEDLQPIRFPLEDRSSGTGFYMSLQRVLDGCRIHSLNVDVPKDSRRRMWRFACLDGFGFVFETDEGDSLPYLFQLGGTVRFYGVTASITAEDENVAEIQGECRFNFPVMDARDGLFFTCFGLRLRLDVPAVFWRFDNDPAWHVEPPHQIWHRDLPDVIAFSGTSEPISLCMAEGSEDFEGIQEVAAVRNAQSGVMVCDMIRFHTWITRENLLETINLRIGRREEPFLQIITRSACLSGVLEGDYQNGLMRAKFDIIGYSEYFVDLHYGGKELVRKAPLKNGVLEVSMPLFSGLYEAEVFECEEDDSGFGEPEYYSIYRCKTQLVNPYRLEGNILKPTGIRSQDIAAQSFSLDENYEIELNQRLERNVYGATLNLKADGLKTCLSEQVTVEFPDIENLSVCRISYCEDGDDSRLYFLLDQRTRRIVREEDRSLHRAVRYRRYRLLDECDLFDVHIVTRTQAPLVKSASVTPDYSSGERSSSASTSPEPVNRNAHEGHKASFESLSSSETDPTLADAGVKMLTVNRVKPVGIRTVGDLVRRITSSGVDSLKRIQGLDKRGIHELLGVYNEYACKG